MMTDLEETLENADRGMTSTNLSSVSNFDAADVAAISRIDAVASILRSSNQGLGLGLYIASEIARVHGGKIEVASSKEETRFTLRIPAA
jgi:signal transduction histidine kinase